MSRPEPLLIQASVKAVDEDGMSAAVVGTVLFTVAAVFLGLNEAWLIATNNVWWLWVAITGAVIGVLFGVTCVLRRHKHR